MNRLRESGVVDGYFLCFGAGMDGGPQAVITCRASNDNNNDNNKYLYFKRVTQSNGTLIFPVALSIQHRYGTPALGSQGYKIALHIVHLSTLF